MKLIFALLLIANLLVFGWFKLDAAPMKVELQSREKNASAVKVVTGKLGASPEPTTAAEASPEPVASSAPPSSSPAMTSAPKASPTPSATVKVAGHCVRWTGITGEQIDAAREKLRTLGISATETSSGESSKVWVYMPPLDSLEAAKAKAAQLAEMGVTDYFVVNNGGRWQNAISLGIFSTREAGERHLAELQAKGVRSAVVRDRDDTLKQASFNAKNVSDQQLEKLNKLSLQFKGSVLRDLACAR
ncbi:SPOR domain-containing protein [Chitinibacter fontanus]|uniref:SPOR domain-containing protein n=1 Tax=Chitinibacter fontanus TaxID=1737446 RepID=A0A7D5V8F3_9NEIS|nr:SPOR domain-containing protein [Chitinibacter fontanus]QLI80659.1 SPOR domain-containing protein [Chitinibacter fontanus]